MKKSFLVILFALAAPSLSAQEPVRQTGCFYNPVIRGDVADPSIIAFKGSYYATGTSSEWAPFYPVFESKDLVNWKQTGHIFNEKPAWAAGSFWAPELFVHGGRVYCYYTARREDSGISYIGVASARSPRHGFTDHGPVVEYGTESIDAFVFEDGGELYISWKAYGLDRRPIEILGCKLTADGLRLDGEPFTMMRDDERIGMEGQYHFKRGDYYYIVYAARGCCGPQSDYEVWVARSRSLKGPYEKYEGNPILYAGGDGGNGGESGDFKACGHGTAVETPDGRLFYMCHAYLPGEGYYAGRQPVLQEMFVNDAGWVEFRTGRVALARQPLPFAGTAQKPVADFVDEFDGFRLRVDWTWNYPFSDVDAKVKKGRLVLGGRAIGGNKYGSALCLRAQSPDYSYETVVADAGTSVSGLTMYGDARNLVVFGVQGTKLLIKVIDDGKESVLYETDIVSEAPHLKIDVEKGCVLTFLYSADGVEWAEPLAEPLDRRDLVRWDRVARPGVIHIGGEDTPAEFTVFKVRTLF